jgi:hypothetical protein
MSHKGHQHHNHHQLHHLSSAACRHNGDDHSGWAEGMGDAGVDLPLVTPAIRPASTSIPMTTTISPHPTANGAATGRGSAPPAKGLGRGLGGASSGPDAAPADTATAPPATAPPADTATAPLGEGAKDAERSAVVDGQRHTEDEDQVAVDSLLCMVAKEVGEGAPAA